MTAPVPHAEFREGDIWWRGTGPRFWHLGILHARRLLPNLTGEIAFLAPDLKHAIEEYDHVHARTDQAA